MTGGVYSIDGSEAVVDDIQRKLCDSDEPDTKKVRTLALLWYTRAQVTEWP